jgi:predicted Zn finger-like uncharacterized protein
MTAVTRCPQCSTRFKAAQEQLDAHGGLVRCGRCQAVFNAIEHLCDTEPSPQLSLPIMLEEEPGPPAAPAEGAGNGPVPAHPGLTGENAAATLEQQITIAPEPLHPARKPARNKPAWPWAVGSLLLAVVLLAQAAYYFRIELAARLPALKPVLLSYCALLGCSVPLPGKAELVSIESSDMEADAAQPGAITLNASLRNRAPYAQAYPSLELTLTDTQDKVVARRSFRPSEYLKPGEDEPAGLPPGREASIKLHLDVADLRPTGYRLFLYYPQ